MRPLYACLVLSVVTHGLIFLISPAEPEMKKIRLDEKKPIRLVALAPPRPAPPSRSVPPPSPTPSRQERKKPFKRKPEGAIKSVEKQPPPLKKPEEIREPLEEPLEEQIERPERMREVKTPEEEVVERTETENVELETEPAEEASPREVPPVSENLFEPPFSPSEKGDTPQTASVSESVEEDLLHPVLEGIRDDYLASLREKIEAVRRYPDRARRMGQEGKVVVRFIVRAGGEVERVDLAEPSSFPLLNQAAMETIHSIPSLPPLPSEFGDRMEVTIPLVYRLEQSAKR